MRITLSKLVFLVLVAFSIVSCSKEEVAPVPVDTVQPTAKYNYIVDEVQVLDLINAHRESLRLNNLEKIDYVSLKSEEHTNYMIATGAVNHNFFQDRYESIMKTLNAVNVSENLAYNFASPESVVNAWLNSEGHKTNIEGDFTHFGISIRTNAQGKKYYTNIFVKK